MRFSTSILLVALTSLASASNPPYGPYNVTNYFSDCIGGIGCLYSFDITFAPESHFPKPNISDTESAFTTSCSGDDQHGAFQACQNANISSNLLQTPTGSGNVFVQHTYSVPFSAAHKARTYIVTGNTTVPLVTGQQNINVTIFADKKTGHA